jgi:tetratricopeptide (TPR) repeat protein
VSQPFARLGAALGRRYTLERELGRGGMGTVYLAFDRKHQRRVAIKVLPADLAAAVGPERFLREIGIVARLSHPNILPLHDSGQADGLLYYVMPHVEGGSLRLRLQQASPVPVPEALRLAREVADALAYAHAQGVIHRDVKPDNILLHEGHALLADFGVARALGDDQVTDSGLAIGTAAYASPEQASGSRVVDHRSDVYGLGCVLYEMLAGSAPHGHELLARRFTEPLPQPSGLREDVPPWIDMVIARALAARPHDRFPTAAAFRDALSAPEHDVDWPAASKPRGRIRWMAAGAVALASIGTALAFLPSRLSRADSRQVVVAGFENKTGDPGLAPVGDIAIDYIARGLATTRLLHEVFDARATALEAGQPVRIGVAAGRELAKRVGAGTVLGGSYYREGDSLHFEAQLVDATSGKLILSLEPVVGSLRDRTRVVESLRQRVMAGFASVFQPAFEDWQATSVPPTYQAYEEMLASTDDLWVFKTDEAVVHLHRAIAQDSSYTGAQARLMYALAFLPACGEVDSVAGVMVRSGGRLPPAELGWVSYAEASCRHDVPGKLAAAKAVLGATPRSASFTVLAGINAIELSRPREALEILRRFDAEHVPLGPQQRNVYWSFIGYAYHDLGEFEKQLQAASHMSEDPDIERARALAGRGDSGAVRRLVAGWLDHADTSGLALERAECAALELRAHAAAATAVDLLDRIATVRGPGGAAVAGSEPCLWNLFSAHYYAGRLNEARTAYERGAAEDTSDVRARAALAAIAARRGDPVELERQQRWLAVHAGAASDYALSRVAALQGRRAEAVELLRKAMEGDLERHFLHIDPDFESLRAYPPYRELLRPRG